MGTSLIWQGENFLEKKNRKPHATYGGEKVRERMYKFTSRFDFFAAPV